MTRSGKLAGDRGGKRRVIEVLIFSTSVSASGDIVEAEIGYRGHIWKLDRFGLVYRINNGHRMTVLLDFATLTERS